MFLVSNKSSHFQIQRPLSFKGIHGFPALFHVTDGSTETLSRLPGGHALTTQTPRVNPWTTSVPPAPSSAAPSAGKTGSVPRTVTVCLNLQGITHFSSRPETGASQSMRWHSLPTQVQRLVTCCPPHGTAHKTAKEGRAGPPAMNGKSKHQLPAYLTSVRLEGFRLISAGSQCIEEKWLAWGAGRGAGDSGISISPSAG